MTLCKCGCGGSPKGKDKSFLPGHGSIGRHHTQDAKDRISISNKGQKRSQQTKDNISNSLKGHPGWNKGKPDIGMSGKQHTIQTKNQMSLTRLKLFEDGYVSPLKGFKRSKETNLKESISKTDWDFVYEHGCKRSQFPYADGFNQELKEQIADRDCWICQECRAFLNDTNNIHHIDYDKTNHDPLNLIDLCKSCHGKTNGGKANRKYWKNHFQQYQQERNDIERKK